MKLTKANVRKIQLKTRNYKCSKDLTDTYICELDVVAKKIKVTYEEVEE